MTIGELIHQQRKKMKLTMEDLGKICNVPRSTISRWENGIIKTISRDRQEKLCIALDIDPLMFFQKEEIISREEMTMLTAYREADDKVKEIVLDILLRNKKSSSSEKVG
jgi:transcriptional regulator with XRE-family HTH domain